MVSAAHGALRGSKAFTLRVYSHMMRRSDKEREELKGAGGGPGFGRK
jgi:hypothetical protein